MELIIRKNARCPDGTTKIRRSGGAIRTVNSLPSSDVNLGGTPLIAFSVLYDGTPIGILIAMEGGWTYSTEWSEPTREQQPTRLEQGVVGRDPSAPRWIYDVLLPDLTHPTIARVIENESVRDELSLLLRFHQPKESPWKIRSVA